MENIAPNQPLYLYQSPMFMVTVSTVLIIENGIVIIDNERLECGIYAGEPVAGHIYNVPHGIVKAGQESVQFAAVRYVKEQTGIRLTKEALIPVDYRSDPDRSEEGNVMDMGFVAMLDIDADSLSGIKGSKWVEVDFEKRKLCKDNNIVFYMDQDILLERALEIAFMMKE